MPRKKKRKDKSMETKKLPKRSEVEEKYKWRIEDLYANDDAWQSEYDKMKELLEKASEYEGRLGKSSDILAGFLQLQDEIDGYMERIYVYANQKYHEDTNNSVYQGLSSKASSLSSNVSAAMAFAVPEILEIPDQTLADFVRENDKLKDYEIYLQNVLRVKPHILSKEMEELLADAGEVAEGPSNIFSMFNNADIKFPEIKNEAGEKVQITHGRYVSFLESSNRRVRKDAFEGVYHTYGAFKNTLASTFYANLKQEAFYAKARKYNSNMEMELDGTDVPVQVYENLIETVHDHMDLMHKYVRLRKKLLGVDELHMYDLYAPLVNDVDLKIPFEEAKELVEKGLAPLGEDYLNI